MTGYKIVGNEYTSPDFDANEFAREMIEKCKEFDFPWTEMRMDKNGGFYAYSTPATTQRSQWAHEGFTGDSRHLTTLDGDEVSWQDFGIIRTDTPETQDAPSITESFTWTNAPKYQAGETVWQRPHVEQPERTIADMVTLTDNRLTVDHIDAIAKLCHAAQMDIVQAIADGRIVLGGGE